MCCSFPLYTIDRVDPVMVTLIHIYIYTYVYKYTYADACAFACIFACYTCTYSTHSCMSLTSNFYGNLIQLTFPGHPDAADQ